MKNINSENCKYMRIGNGRLIPFSPEIPDLSNGDVKVKYYLTTKLSSLEEEFKSNDNVISIDLSNLDTSELISMNNAFNGCVNLERIDFGKTSNDVSIKDAFVGVPTDIELGGENELLISDAEFAIRPPKDYLLFTIPSKDTVITSIEDNGKFNFYATDKGATIPVILSNWDEYDAYISEKDATKPDLVYFLNTQHCKDLGVPNEEKFISKNNKNSVITTPRVCIADNEVLNIHIPDGLDVDYFVIHSSGHNGAKSEYEYVYGSEDGVYIESKVVVPASEGTSDIVVRCRDKRSDYEIFNGTLENCKKVWVSIDFYKYHEDQRIPELPPVEHVNPPIDDSAYEIIGEGTKISTNINALSGLCLAEDKSCLYGVSDTYGLYKIEFDGKSELIVETEKDMEGLCLGPNGDLFACIENEQQIVKFSKESDYKQWEVVSTVDADKLLETMQEFNNGFEGIAYNQTTGNFYLGNQFKPISITEYSQQNGIVGIPVILKFDNQIGGTTEVGDLQYDSQLDCFWVIDSRSSNIYKYDKEGNNLASFKTNIGSKPNTESMFIDFENKKLYVGCDNATGDIYVFDFDPHKKEETPTEKPLTAKQKFTNFLTSGEGIFTLEEDLNYTTQWVVRKNNLTIDLNGHNITNTMKNNAMTKNTNFFLLTINGETPELKAEENIVLTIKDSVGTGTMNAGNGVCKSLTCLRAMNGAKICIESGNFIVGGNNTGGSNSCVFSENGKLEISGGKFESSIQSTNGVNFVINALDNDNSEIIITGGSFVNQDPSNSKTEPGGANWVPEGYVVESKEEDGHTLYTVFPQSSTNA